MRFWRYTVSLKHDKGKVHLTTVATKRASAIEAVLTAERAPLGAVLAVKRGKCIADTNRR